MKTPDRYTKFCEKAPQTAGTYTYTMSMWEPPRGLLCISLHKSAHVHSIWRAAFVRKYYLRPPQVDFGCLDWDWNIYFQEGGNYSNVTSRMR